MFHSALLNSLESLLDGHIESGQCPHVSHAVNDPERIPTELGKPETHTHLPPLVETNVLQQSCTISHNTYYTIQ